MAGDDDKDKIIEILEKELQQKEENLHLAGEIGKSLLQENNDWEIKCEKISEEYSHRIEVC